jgi:acetylornithine/succinyldiaminopimelate/putrescine aminotransferase
LKEVQVGEAGSFAEGQEEGLQAGTSYVVLAAKNATLRLRGPSGHVYSFTDLTSGQGAVNFGHLNPGIDPFEGLSSDLVSTIFPPAAGAYSEWLLKKLAVDEKTVLYRVGAPAGVGHAIHLARRRRPGKVVLIDGSCHEQEAIFGRDWTAGLGEAVVRIAAGEEFSDWDQVSCLLYEPVQSTCGSVPISLPWIRGLSRAAQAAGVTVIADETQCGFYRFGRLSLAASEYLYPDIFLFGNSMTNGIYPLFAVVCPEALAGAVTPIDGGWQPTFETSALGLRAAECVAQYIDSTDMERLVLPILHQLSKASEKLAANPNLTTFHLAGPTLSLGVRDGRAAELVRACEERGVLMSAGAGGSRVRIAPPLTIDALQLQVALKVVVQAAGTL